VSLGELNFGVRYETYNTRILFLKDTYVRYVFYFSVRASSSLGYSRLVFTIIKLSSLTYLLTYLLTSPWFLLPGIDPAAAATGSLWPRSSWLLSLYNCFKTLRL